MSSSNNATSHHKSERFLSTDEASAKVALVSRRASYSGDLLNLKMRPLKEADIEYQWMAEARRKIKDKERVKGDGGTASGTGLTEGKFREPTLSRLIAKGKIGSAECQAIDEIEYVYMQLCGRLWLKGYEIKERTSAGSHAGLSTRFLDAYFKRYKPWADEWSARRKKFNDLTMEVVFDVVMSSRTGKQLDGDRNWRNGTGLRVFVNGVRDYAAMAGWVSGVKVSEWQTAARSIFPMRKM